jgi:hypothetical protein
MREKQKTPKGLATPRSRRLKLLAPKNRIRKYLAETAEPEPGAPSLASAHWSLALAPEKQGRKPDAVAELKKRVAAQADFESAHRDLKRLK